MSRPGSRDLPRAAAVQPQEAGPVDAHRPVVDGRERSPQEIRADRDRLRADLGDTVQELAHRVDVPARLRERRRDASAQVRARARRAQEVLDDTAPPVGRAVREQPVLVLGALGGSILLLAAVRRRRKS